MFEFLLYLQQVRLPVSWMWEETGDSWIRDGERGTDLVIGRQHRILALVSLDPTSHVRRVSVRHAQVDVCTLRGLRYRSSQILSLLCRKHKTILQKK